MPHLKKTFSICQGLNLALLCRELKFAGYTLQVQIMCHIVDVMLGPCVEPSQHWQGNVDSLKPTTCNWAAHFLKPMSVCTCHPAAHFLKPMAVFMCQASSTFSETHVYVHVSTQQLRGLFQNISVFRATGQAYRQASVVPVLDRQWSHKATI